MTKRQLQGLFILGKSSTSCQLVELSAGKPLVLLPRPDKLAACRTIHAVSHENELKFVALRYFNAAGAIPTRGEHHEPETHIIPNVLAAAAGKLPHVTIFGGDYPTPDGTAIRDYIHVADLGAAHILALKHLRSGQASECINLGNGQGYSVMEVVEAARQVTGLPIEVKIEPARPGDPSRLIANAEKAHTVLGWQPNFPDLATIIRSAWEWHQTRPRGSEL